MPDRLPRGDDAAGILSYRLLSSSATTAAASSRPGAIRANALVAVSTHDLPTLAGCWRGHDIAWRQRARPVADEAAAAAGAGRERDGDRARLLGRLQRAGLLPAASAADAPPAS